MRVRSGIAAVALALLSIAMAKDAATIHSLRLDGVLVRRQSSRPGPVTNQPVSRPSNSQQSEPKVAPKPKPNPKTKANPNVNSRVPQQNNQPKGKIEPNAGGGKAGRPQGIPAQQLNNQRVGQQNPKFKGGGGSVPKQNKGGLPQPNPGDIRQNDNTRQKQQGRQNQQSGQNQQELRKKKKQGKQDQQNQEEQQEQQDQQEQQNQNEQNANDKQSGNDQQSQNNVETKKFKIGNVRAVFQVPINEIQTGKEGLEGQDAKPGQTTSEQ